MRATNLDARALNDQARQKREQLERDLQTSYAQALAGDVLSEEESLARVAAIEDDDAE